MNDLEILKFIILIKKISVEQVTTLMGISRNQLNKIRNGEAELKQKHIDLFCYNASITIEQFRSINRSGKEIGFTFNTEPRSNIVSEVSEPVAPYNDNIRLLAEKDEHIKLLKELMAAKDIIIAEKDKRLALLQSIIDEAAARKKETLIVAHP
jgi:transcriptional regulator with XRE-family HTH domain